MENRDRLKQLTENLLRDCLLYFMDTELNKKQEREFQINFNKMFDKYLKGNK